MFGVDLVWMVKTQIIPALILVGYAHYEIYYGKLSNLADGFDTLMKVAAAIAQEVDNVDEKAVVSDLPLDPQVESYIDETGSDLYRGAGDGGGGDEMQED